MSKRARKGAPGKLGASDWKARVEAATVRLPRKEGQGVLVHGGFVLTATHCIEWSGTGGMVLGDRYLEPVETVSGATFRLSPVAADPLSDIAVLGEPDNQVFSDDAEAFERWRESIDPVRLGGFDNPGSLAPAGTVQVKRTHCLTHGGDWVKGRAERRWFPGQTPNRIPVEMTSQIRGGTSGGPIVDDRGLLLCIVSETNEVAAGPCDGLQPVARYALPHWVLAQISWATERSAPD